MLLMKVITSAANALKTTPVKSRVCGVTRPAAEATARTSAAVPIAPTNAASGTGTTTDGRFSAVTSVRAGRYLLKLAAIDAGGRQASAEHRLWARISGSADVRVSELMLAEAGSEQETLRPVVISAPRDRMVAYLEVYASAGWRPPEDAVTVTVTKVGSPDGLTSARAAAKDAGNGRWTFRAELPLGDLAPGAYTAAARLTIGTPGAVLERAFVVRER